MAHHANESELIRIITDISEQLCIVQPSPLHSLKWPFGTQHPSVLVKRDDLLHPIISGNKWRKLQHPLARLVQQKHERVLSFGGGYSNHIHALAFACQQLSIDLVCIIRGHYASNMTPMLNDIASWGADIVFVDKSEYQLREDPNYLQALQKKYKVKAIIPEGGSNQDGVAGVTQIIDELTQQHVPDVLVCPVGSAGTLAGLIQGCQQRKLPTQIVGISVLNAGNSHLQKISQFCPQASHSNCWSIHTEFAHGGYAKRSEELRLFLSQWHATTDIRLDPVYNAKSFYAVNQMLKQESWRNAGTVCILQTGGNQGGR